MLRTQACARGLRQPRCACTCPFAHALALVGLDACVWCVSSVVGPTVSTLLFVETTKKILGSRRGFSVAMNEDARGKMSPLPPRFMRRRRLRSSKKNRGVRDPMNGNIWRPTATISCAGHTHICSSPPEPRPVFLRSATVRTAPHRTTTWLAAHRKKKLGGNRGCAYACVRGPAEAPSRSAVRTPHGPRVCHGMSARSGRRAPLR